MEDDQQFCLRWNNHQSTLIQNFDTLLESGTLVDCTLAAEGKYLKAHKVVLSACSPYFEGLLSEHYDKHPVFILKDVKFKELKAMMDYMYRGEVNISQDQLTALLKAAESLQIKGLSDSKTGGSTSTTGKSSSDSAPTRQTKSTAGQAAATAAPVDIPHTSSGLTIEKNKVPRQSLQQAPVCDLPEDSASPQCKGLSSREGSTSPTRKRKRQRRRSLGNDDNSMENHEASNSSDANLSVPPVGVAAVAEDKTHADQAVPVGRSALMQQLTKPADEMIQIPMEKPEPNEEIIQPKSEYLDDQESVEDLTHLDDDMNDMEMDQDSRPGPSTQDGSQHPGMAHWHMAGDRSNTSVGAAAGAPGVNDEVFLAAQEAAQAQRDSQGIPRKRLPIKTSDAIKPLKEEEKSDIHEVLIKEEFDEDEESVPNEEVDIFEGIGQLDNEFQQFDDNPVVQGTKLIINKSTNRQSSSNKRSKVIYLKSARRVEEVKEELKIAERTPEKIPYKVVIPKKQHSLDTFEGWCMRNLTRNKSSTSKPKTMPTKQPTMRGKPPYRMTANLRMALEAVDAGVGYDSAATAFGILEKRLRTIKQLEIDNPTWILHRKSIQKQSIEKV
ncbi:longitudinals lacking protein, isoforms H/M/V isoform X2 [Phymastichus coffea]|uniref:longitudinals lacking protein, isoforms H/M/V isoform X2 n=1 Tax=Phymastichus coffea TaxID=108790 RepID=UPI00273C5EAA|nr:longitudinals lacking protein, isoforms H/M/V isoform X2 [Phymastichus coffea]